MSTAARKARKRTGTPFVRTPKVGTPVLERRENQPRPIHGNIRSNQPTRFGYTSRTIRRLLAVLPAGTVVRRNGEIEQPKPIARRRHSK